MDLASPAVSGTSVYANGLKDFISFQISPRAVYTDSDNMLTAGYSLSWPGFK